MEQCEQITAGPRVMVVDDDPYLLAAIHQTLTMHQYQVASFDKPFDALAALLPIGVSAVIADVKMPGINGLELLERVRTVDRDLPVILITGHGDVEMAVRAMKGGAYDFLEKPVDEDILLASLARAVEKMELLSTNRRLHEQLAQARQHRTSFYGLIGQHPLMQRLYDTMAAVAREEDPVLISGETGTGKELVARAIHGMSDRRDRPFVAVNMGAIPADMMEAELFGYEKGAFTGAGQTKIGKFEFAGSGTIFLDEICSLPVHLQAKLLRVLEDRAFTRLGANAVIAVQARVIAATNSNLEDEIAAGRFRQDLYFRLNVLPIETPPLRDHQVDIPLLVMHFCAEFGMGGGRVEELLKVSMPDLCRNAWQGNVRELRNHVRRFCIYGESALTAGVGNLQQINSDGPPFATMPLKKAMDEAEKKHISEVLGFFNGQIARACKALGVSRKCLYDKIAKHDVDLAAMRGEGGAA